MDFEFLLRLSAFANNKIISKICYETLLEPVSEEIKCVKNMMPKEDYEIPLYEARKCWKGRKEPNELIRTNDEKIKLKKQHYWNDKVNA
jgi:hypothetical protein